MSDAPSTTTTTTANDLPASVVQEIAETVATAIAARAPEGTGRPQVRVESPAGSLSLGEGMAGSFTLAILYETTTYKLTVSIPGGATPTYDFKLTEQTGTDAPIELAAFTYTASNDWRLKVSVPRIKVSETFVIETISLELSDTPPTT
jgi:hypothetical protein